MRSSQVAGLVIGRRVLCRYVGTPTWHERLLLVKAGTSGTEWAIVTPDGDVYIEDFGDKDIFDGARLVPLAGGRPSGVVGKIHPFLSVPTAALRAKWNKEARAAIVAYDEELKKAAATKEKTDNDRKKGLTREKTVESILDAEEEEPTEPAKPDEHGRRPGKSYMRPAQLWAFSDTPEISVGDKVPDGCWISSSKTLGEFLFMDSKGNSGLCTDKQDEVEARRIDWIGRLRGWLKKDGDETPGRKRKDEEDEESDVRILPMRVGRDERRFRRLEDCEIMYDVQDFEDWPIPGARSLSRDIVGLSRNGHSWLAHHDNRVSRSKVPDNNRSIKEHAVLCRSLHYLTTHDQVQTPNLAGAEVINLRRSLIESAHRVRPEQPDWTGAEDYMGESMAADGALINPDRVNYVATRQGARAKIQEASRRAREEAAWNQRRGPLPSDEAEGAAAGEDATGAAKPKGGGKKKG